MDFIIGIFVGAFLFWVFVERKTASGSFIVDLNDPMEETFKLEMYESLGEICNKKQIFLNVKILTDDSLK